MSIENKDVELNDEELRDVAGGSDDLVGIGVRTKMVCTNCNTQVEYKSGIYVNKTVTMFCTHCNSLQDFTGESFEPAPTQL